MSTFVFVVRVCPVLMSLSKLFATSGMRVSTLDSKERRLGVEEAFSYRSEVVVKSSDCRKSASLTIPQNDWDNVCRAVFFYGAFHGAPVLETLSFSRFLNDFSLHWDFAFFTFSPCTIDFEFLRFFHVLDILSFYDFLLYWRLWTFHCFPLY